LQAAATIDDDLRACSVDKMTAYAQSSETKWNKRPTSAHPAGRPSTAGADAAELPRPGTAPPGTQEFGETAWGPTQQREISRVRGTGE